MSFEALNRFMAQEVPSARIPGCDLLIYHHGKHWYFAGNMAFATI